MLKYIKNIFKVPIYYWYST